MPFSPRISEIAQRERFVRHAVAHRAVFAVAGEDGLARVPSQRQRGRQVTLLWSTRAEAEHWAPVVAVNPRVKQLPLAALFAEVLPALAGLERLVGPDWCADPAEAELDPIDLAERLRLPGLHPGRAPTIVAGTVILVQVMRAFGLDEVEVSERDILHGSALSAAVAPA